MTDTTTSEGRDTWIAATSFVLVPTAVVALTVLMLVSGARDSMELAKRAGDAMSILLLLGWSAHKCYLKGAMGWSTLLSMALAVVTLVFVTFAFSL